MSNDTFPGPQFHSQQTTAASQRAGLVTRARTRWRRGKLDEQLARGIDPETSDELRLRAAQLSSHSGRAHLANALVERLGEARGPNLGAFRVRTRRQDDAIREAADDLNALVARLREERPVEIRGAARAARLLYGKDSPLHRDSGPDLKDALRTARAALDASAPETHGVAMAA